MCTQSTILDYTQYSKRRDKAERFGLYNRSYEHDACGVGLVAAINGKKSRSVVLHGIEALKVLWHRGAVAADGKSGDGAGLHIQIPIEFFYDQIARTGHIADKSLPIAIGQIFLPRTDFHAQETCRAIVESEILRMGYTIYGWRHVPVNSQCLGAYANATRPEIEQILIANSKNNPTEHFERELYVIRRRIEKAVIQARINQFYICSLSCRSIIYKGMMLAEQLVNFYPDLSDDRFISAFAIYHQRYSTNTLPEWWLAQPFRTLAHNGEINTLKGNLNWMKSHEILLSSDHFGDWAEDIKPIVAAGASDSAALDAVFEVLVRAGRDAPMAKTLLIPESWSKQTQEMPPAWQAMYAYTNAIMEPWDGPAALAMTDGRWVCAGLDRNGLRPLRYAVTKDGLLVAGSEAGAIVLPDAAIMQKGALGPGQMIAVDLDKGQLFYDSDLKNTLAAQHPFKTWADKITALDTLTRKDEIKGKNSTCYSGQTLRQRQIAAGYSIEDIEHVLSPMAETGKEVVASMGDDTPLAVLSTHYRPLSHFLRQNFSQVTNPPIDSLREHRVMSLKTRFGNLKNMLAESDNNAHFFVLESPFISNSQFAAMIAYFGDSAAVLECTFAAANNKNTLADAVHALCHDAAHAVKKGKQHIILSDQNQNAERVAIPMLLATSAVHHSLTEKGLRTYVSLHVRSGECVDPHGFATLIGVGATTVNAYLAEDTLGDRCERGLLPMKHGQAIKNYRTAIEAGLLKIMSKMGISIISSYRGGGNFEAIGLSRSLMREFFPSMPSRISGIGLNGIQRKLCALHQKAWHFQQDMLPIGGFYKARQKGETHAWNAMNMKTLQTACERGSFALWKQYSAQIAQTPPIHLRDLLGIKPLGKPIPIEQVESITDIRKRFVTPGMSLGALSPEAHQTLSIAMNQIGAKSDSGEGGEDPALSLPNKDGRNLSAKIKQIASGRFGVTAEYLNNCEELEIKISQGAKPGEGGQLPGIKVTDLIARLRHSTKGVTLISPPPHHDIYSIEDLAQLIYDLKQINPVCKVTVKLVSASGVGTIAAGVAKAKADIILISGHNGGTGASPATSIKYTGMPWELGLSETHQTLLLNDLRTRVTLRTDGGLRTGRDVVIAALMGAEEYGIGTAALIAMGCIMVRQCHSNTCPVGICTQDEELREKFHGTAERVVNLITFYALEIREILAELGAPSIDHIIGRCDLLSQVSRGSEYLDDLDLTPLLITIDEHQRTVYNRHKPRVEVKDTLDNDIMRDAERFFDYGERMQLSYPVNNTLRAIGARLSSSVFKRFGTHNDLSPDHLTVVLNGAAGQSAGAFLVKGIKLKIFGEANDYVGKGLSGGTIVVCPPNASTRIAAENAIIGNTVLYGATGGFLFAAGRAGERFAVRNSGASVVIEGCGSNGCEYMTGGVAVILGTIGVNFGAGMTGGMAYIYDPENQAEQALNQDTLIINRALTPFWQNNVYALIEQHVQATQSQRGCTLLNNWQQTKNQFLQICPREMIPHLASPLTEPTPNGHNVPLDQAG